MGKPYPSYRVFNDAVQLTLSSAMEDPDFVRFIVKEQDSKQVSLSLPQLMILRYIVENRKIKLADVQNVAQISAEEARKCCAELMKFGLIEIIGKEYMLTARVYEAVKSDIEYTRDKTVQYIKAKDMEERTELIKFLKENGIASVFHYIPLHTAPAGIKYGRFNGEDKYTTKESERLLRLPMYYGLKEEDVLKVCAKIKEFYNK